jgi:hypothetical protein
MYGTAVDTVSARRPTIISRGDQIAAGFAARGRHRQGFGEMPVRWRLSSGRRGLASWGRLTGLTSER